MTRKFIITFSLIILTTINILAQTKTIKIGIVGLSHSHVHGLLGRKDDGVLKIVGIVEPNRDLAQRYSKQYGYSMNIVYNTINEMLDATKPDAVTAFCSIYQHLEVVEACAPKGVDVMVEKPLAVSMEHAKKMAALANKFKIHLVTNYETTWYPSNHKASEFLKNDSIGACRKIIIHDGHKGPKKIGVNSEFLDWLVDPVLNGGGAIVDFGCYGVNLTTWLMNGKKPNTVTAITQQFQPENNPKVDDESIIVLTYDSSNAIIQGSWDWPMARKDMEIYGVKGAIYADNSNDLRIHISQGYSEYREGAYKFKDRETPFNDPFAFFAAVVRNEIILKPTDLSSLENNMIVIEILDAARQSAKTKKSVELKNK